MKITIKQAILNEHLNNVIKGISSKNIKSFPFSALRFPLFCIFVA